MVRAAAWIGAAVLFAATIASAWVAAARSREAGREREERASLERQVAALHDQVKQLESRNQELGRPREVPGQVEAAIDRAEVALLRKDMAILKEEVARLEALNRELRRGSRGTPSVPFGGRMDAANLQARAKDGSLAVEDRIEALSRLRMLPTGRTPEVVASMLDLLESGIETAHRADILRHLKGAVPLIQSQRVITLLRSDEQRVVREEAAETLGPLKDDAQVRAALEEAARSDASEEVRRQAKAALESGRRTRN
jgi:cell division protein FtsB